MSQRRAVAGVVVGLLGGVLVALSLPPFGWWPLAWVGFAAIAGFLPGASPKAAAATGAGLGFGQFVIGCYWVQEFSIAGYVALVLVGSLYMTLALLVCPTRRRRGVAIGLPAVLLVAEWARDRFPLHGFPLAGVALGQATGPLLASARVRGSLLVTALTVFAGCAIAEVVRAVRDPASGSYLLSASNRGRPTRVARLAAVAATAVALAAVTATLPVIGWLSPGGGGGGHREQLRVALVQGGGSRGTRAVNTDPQVVFNRHLDAARTIVAPVDLVVWPEGVLQSPGPYQSSTDAAAVSDLAQRLGATVIVGVDQNVGPTHYVNDAVAWGPAGNVVDSYQKNHLVPFGEYVPFRSFIQKVFNLADVPYDGLPGHRPGFLSTPAGPLGVMISYEVFFDSRARGAVQAGGQLLVVPTNTSSYRSTQVPTEELAADRLRAVETGRWLVQVTPTGYSAVLSASGQVLERSTLGARTVVYATVPLRTGMTPYVHLGDGPFMIAGVVLLLAGWAVSRSAWLARSA
ncbi:MAG: apolipoprotein N-acyltransferase [Acidimicrobiales bacterium]|nr:apolipoprotein N-acyltransferase [Acidimicrobiales bacterium]